MSRLMDVIRWLEVRGNRRILAAESDRDFWSLYQSDGAALEQPPPSLRAASAQPTDLLIVLTTYNRPGACARILDQLPGLVANAGRPLITHLLVVRDAGGAGYASAAKAAGARFGERLTWLEARAPLGKPGFWKTYQTIFLAARLLRPAHTLFLQDDLDLAPTLIRDCYSRWDALARDTRARVFYLCAADDDEPEGRWIRFRRREVAPGLRLTQWFDLQAFLVDRAFFELLHHRVFPVSERRWKKKPYSSGVGEQLTRRLLGRANIYQATPSLVFHGAHPSEMNPEARSLRSLDNRPPGGARES